MRTILVTALALIALVQADVQAAPAKHAAAKRPYAVQKVYPAFEFRGRRIGDPKPAQPERPYYEDEKMGDVTLKGSIDYHYDETGFYSLMGLFRSRDVERLRNIFTAKYGAPSKSEMVTMTNGYGAQTQKQVDSWNFKEGQLQLIEQGYNPGDGFFYFQNEAHQARERASQKARDAEAAKGI